MRVEDDVEGGGRVSMAERVRLGTGMGPLYERGISIALMLYP
tara:strand:- start:1135 stop:1260 length:126 start_codon:yes stop_codon:yes gene_type:complete